MTERMSFSKRPKTHYPRRTKREEDEWETEEIISMVQSFVGTFMFIVGFAKAGEAFRSNSYYRAAALFLFGGVNGAFSIVLPLGPFVSNRNWRGHRFIIKAAFINVLLQFVCAGVNAVNAVISWTTESTVGRNDWIALLGVSCFIEGILWIILCVVAHGSLHRMKNESEAIEQGMLTNTDDRNIFENKEEEFLVGIMFIQSLLGIICLPFGAAAIHLAAVRIPFRWLMPATVVYGLYAMIAPILYICCYLKCKELLQVGHRLTWAIIGSLIPFLFAGLYTFIAVIGNGSLIIAMCALCTLQGILWVIFSSFLNVAIRGLKRTSKGVRRVAYLRKEESVSVVLDDSQPTYPDRQRLDESQFDKKNWF